MISKKLKRAFSLLELSMVIVIIGILIAGIIGSKYVIAKSRLVTAQSMVRSSPINSIPGNILWLESSLSDVSLGQNLETGDYVTSWLDNSYNQNKVGITVAGVGPTYANTINYVQAVKFGSSSSNDYLQISDASFLNGTNYTIFILEKRISKNSGVGNYLIGASGSLALGYETETSVIQSHGEGSSGTNQANIESLSSYSDKPRVMTFMHSSSGNKIYINATLANQNSSNQAKAHLSGLTSLAIGKGYNGEIGEIVIFNRSLADSERKEIEDYLTSKWRAPNNRGVSTSCTNGIVTSSGCDSSCAAPVVNGITSVLTIADGGSRSYSCDATGYTGSTPSYSCSNGSLSPTPAITDCTANGCSSGYIVYSGSCFQGCTVGTIAGTSYSGQSVANGTAVTCDLANYNGATLGTCSGGNPINGTCGCASGYISSSGSCVLGCAVGTIAGTSYSGQTVANGTVVTCNSTNYDGSTLGTCSAGTPISGTCACASGYNTDGGTCKQKCSITAATIGVSSDVTVNSGSSSYSCSNSGASYTGTVTYTCNNGSLSSVSGTCSFSDSYVVLTSGSSYTIPSGSGYAHVKIWAIGAGGGGHGMTTNTYNASGGGGGGVAYKTWSISGGETVSYSIGTAGTGSNSQTVNGSDGGATSVTLSGTTIYGNGGKGAAASGASAGGTYSGGDGGSNGGSAPASISQDAGSSGGGAIGAVNGNSQSALVGGAGANSANISSLFTALTAAGYATTSGGTAGVGTGPVGAASGGNASGFGCGGGGAGGWGGNGGNGRYGGGGGGAAGEGAGPFKGGDGGAGAVVIRLTN